MAYTHGGGSAHLDAAYEWYDADEGNAGHANRAEKTVRFFDYREGAVSGLDLTVAYTLAEWASIVSAVSEVFDAEEDTAATDAATVDDEDPPNELSVLWGFNVAYPDAANTSENPNPLEQDVSSGAASTSLRCGSWAIARGIKYAVVSDKIVDGRAHGAVNAGGELVRSSEGVSKIWRREPAEGAEWTLVAEVDADSYGHWTAPSLLEVHSYAEESGVSRYLYTLSPTRPEAGSAPTLGEAYVREYVTEVLTPTLARGVCAIPQVRPSFVYVFYGLNGIRHIYSAPPDAWFQSHRSQVPYSLPRQDTSDEEDACPTGYVDGNGTVHLYFVRDGYLMHIESRDWGASWTQARTKAAGVSKAFVWRGLGGVLQRALWIEGAQLWYAAFSDHLSTLQWTELVYDGVDDVQPCGYDTVRGGIVCYAAVNGVACRWEGGHGADWVGGPSVLGPCSALQVIRSFDGSRQMAAIVRSGYIYCVTSLDHFASAQSTAEVGQAVADHVAIYDSGAGLFCFGFKGGRLCCWSSYDRGNTWLEVGHA